VIGMMTTATQTWAIAALLTFGKNGVPSPKTMSAVTAYRTGVQRYYNFVDKALRADGFKHDPESFLSSKEAVGLLYLTYSLTMKSTYDGLLSGGSQPFQGLDFGTIKTITTQLASPASPLADEAPPLPLRQALQAAANWSDLEAAVDQIGAYYVQ
jgi:hypothetical protein